MNFRGTEFKPEPADLSLNALDIRHIIVEDSNPPPSAANGVHQVTRSLILEQMQAGDYAKLILLTGEETGDAPSDIPSVIIPAMGRKFLGRRVGLDQEVVDAILVHADETTVVHIQGARQPLLRPVVRTLRRRNIPYVMTVHSRYAHIFGPKGELRFPKTAAYVYLIERPMLEAARFVHALSDEEAACLKLLAPRANVQVIPNGAFSSKLGGVLAEPTDLQPSPGFPVFGFCGRLAIEHKGLDLLVGGFAKYRQAGGKGTLVIVGPGDEPREKLSAMCREAAISEFVSIEGPRYGAAKNELILGWDFFVIPSRFDRQPLAALEAGLLGVPLILTRETGLPHVAHNAGLLIESQSDDAVARAFGAAERMSPEEWRKASSNAYRMVRSLGDWSDIAARLRKLYLQA